MKMIGVDSQYLPAFLPDMSTISGLLMFAGMVLSATLLLFGLIVLIGGRWFTKPIPHELDQHPSPQPSADEVPEDEETHHIPWQDDRNALPCGCDKGEHET